MVERFSFENIEKFDVKVLIFQIFLHEYLTLHKINNDYYDKYK